MSQKCLDGEALSAAEVKPSNLDGPLVVVCSTDASLCRLINDVVDVDLQSVVPTEL